MERRTTRSVTARQAASLATKTQAKTVDNKSSAKSGLNSKDVIAEEKSLESTSGPAPKRRKTKSTAPISSAINELPHNLGPANFTSQPLDIKSEQASSKSNSKVKEEIDKTGTEIQAIVDKATTAPEGSPAKTKRTKKTNPYGLTPGVSPFPEWAHPTPEECEEVNRLLSTVHGEIVAPATIPEPSLTVTGCGEVPSVLDALIRTLLSGATTGNNSAMAFNGLVQRFGILEEGIGKGSVNWDAVRQASLKDVFEAIKRGGLADVKSKNLKAILDMVHQENQERRDILVKSESGSSDLQTKGEDDKQYEIACADQNFLSLNHLHNLGTEQVMVELVKYPGIGPKTAACVLLFCLQRPCFAVDTHIFRISKWLNWVPPGKATEVSAFSHLEVRIPDSLKYSLHQLFIRHGKSCPRCRAITGESSAGWEAGCVIDHLVTRTGKRKGGAGSSPASSKKKTSRAKRDSTSESSASVSTE